MYGLPSEISIDILSRLPLPTILKCKCVCKKWLELISSPEFAEHHLKLTSAKSEPGLAFYGSDQTSCKIFEFEDGLDLPSHDHHYKPLTDFDPRPFIANPEPSITIVGSVDGLLCFQDSRAQLDSYYVCNPLTKECISIPGLEETVHYPDVVAYGFGASSSTSQYKVVRINHKAVYGPVRVSNPECFVYTLGSGSWRSVAGSGGFHEYIHYSVGAFLNGYLHWLACDENGSQSISRFDLETEVFESMSPPFPDGYNRSLVILEGCLCYCDHGSDDEIFIWMMREYGSEESWTKQIVIDKYDTFAFISYQAVFPLKIFRNGDVLVLVEHSGMYFYSTRNRTASEVATFQGDNWCQAVLHVSSFLPLTGFVSEDVRTVSDGGDGGGADVGTLIWGNRGRRSGAVRQRRNWA